MLNLIKLSCFYKILFCINCVFLSCSYVYAVDFEDWTPLYRGVEYKKITKKGFVDSAPIHIHQIKIDCNDPKIDFFVTRPNGKGTETIALKTSTFLMQEKAQVVINGSGYSPASLSPEGVLKQIRSLAIYDGIQYGKPEGENAAFIVLNNGTKKIIKMNELKDFKDDISMALGAWNYGGMEGLLLKNGKSCLPEHYGSHEIKARSAMGISKNGDTVYLVVVEGKPRQRSIFKDLVSPSVSMPELASIMIELNCDRAMTLDAGGSSSLVIENIINNQPLVLNIPSDHKGERAVGSHIGIRAEKINSNEQLKIFRSLQENSGTAFFDLLTKSDSALQEIYTNEEELEMLNKKDVSRLDDLFEQSGIERYLNESVDYNKALDNKGKSFEDCFIKDNQYGFFCGEPKKFFEKIGLNPNPYIMKFSDLSFVLDKQGAIKTGNLDSKIYKNENNVFYFINIPKSLKNTMIASKLMQYIMGTEKAVKIMLLEDMPKAVASRMIKGFRIKENQGIGNRNVIGTAEHEIAMDFLGITNRNEKSIGYVALNETTLTPAIIELSHSFQFERKSDYKKNIKEDQDHLHLDQLYRTLVKYSPKEVITALENLLNLSDEQILLEIVRCQLALKEIGQEGEFKLKDAFQLASNLIARKALFEKVWSEIRDNQKGKNVDISKIKAKEEKWKKTSKEKKTKNKKNSKK